MSTDSALPRDATVAVIGAGAMGAGIAQVAAQAGHSVLLFDTRIGAADQASRTISATFDALAAKGKISPDTARLASRRIAAVNVLADCATAQLVIEAIAEDLAAKRALLRELEVIVAPETILASNTSSLSITAKAWPHFSKSVRRDSRASSSLGPPRLRPHWPIRPLRCPRGGVIRASGRTFGAHVH